MKLALWAVALSVCLLATALAYNGRYRTVASSIPDMSTQTLDTWTGRTTQCGWNQYTSQTYCTLLTDPGWPHRS
jgi:hypothetical protein